MGGLPSAEEAPAAAEAAATPESDCQICAEAPRAVRLVPCGHCSTCEKCTIRLITRASARKCPLCRVQFERVAWQSTAPVPLRREPTFEAAADGTGISLREFLLAAAIEPYVVRAPAAVPPALLAEVGAALEVDALRGDGERARLFGAARDRHWTDLVDPDLCLTDGKGGHWKCADAEVDDAGGVRWASAVNHLDSERHGTLLAGLASLLGIALPHLESVSGLRLRGRNLQLVIGAFEHSLAPDADGAPSFYKVSDWHTDGAPAESIVATATFYVEVSETLSGGAVEYARQAEVWVDDPEATLVVQPASGTLVAFNNALLLHRVQTVSGHGRRRLVAFHLRDPDAPPQPPASAEAQDVAELERRRDESRRRRLGRGGAAPARARRATGTFMRGTGTFMAPASGTGSSYAHGTGVSVPTDDEDEGPVDEEDQSSRHLWALVLEYLDGPPEQEYIDESR